MAQCSFHILVVFLYLSDGKALSVTILALLSRILSLLFLMYMPSVASGSGAGLEFSPRVVFTSGIGALLTTGCELHLRMLSSE